MKVVRKQEKNERTGRKSGKNNESWYEKKIEKCGHCIYRERKGPKEKQRREIRNKVKKIERNEKKWKGCESAGNIFAEE